MFEGIVGQERAKGLLSRAVRTDQVSHAYLITGPDGIGKGSFARSFAKAILCTAAPENRPCGFCPSCRHMASGTHPDFLITAPPDGGTIKIDQIRRLIGDMGSRPLEGGGRVCLIEAAQKMTAESQNALLKSLEEPEPGNVFLLTADNPQKLLPTIRSRCQQMPLEPLTDSEMIQVFDTHHLDLTPEQQENLLAEAAGLPGLALSQMSEEAGDQGIKTALMPVICDILKHNLMPIFDFAEKAGKDKRQSLEGADALIQFFVNAAAEQAGAPLQAAPSPLAGLAGVPALTEMAECAAELRKRLETNANPRLQWEAALLRIAEIQENSDEN